MSDIKIPKHIAIIMDGNGRWAKERGLNRTAGHEEGAKTVRKITQYCSNIGVNILLYMLFLLKIGKDQNLKLNF